MPDKKKTTAVAGSGAGRPGRLTPGQLALPFTPDRIADRVPSRRQAALRRAVQAELDLGPVPRRPKPKAGPTWPRFRAVRESVDPADG